MKAICPASSSHTNFYTTAHVQQEWRVDEHGNFLDEVATLETTHGPDPDNIWTCTICGSQAVVENS